MKIDNHGLYYFNELDKGKKLVFPTTINSKKNTKVSFYELLTLKNYIIKCSNKELNHEEYFKMLNIFKDIQNKITLSDLPIGYYQEKGILRGTVIPYYKNSTSLMDISQSKNINKLTSYYHHDDDNLHNLYLLLNDILNILEELQSNNVNYIDSNPSNFLIKDNEVKLIDFDPKYLKYGQDKKSINATLTRFDDLVYSLHLDFRIASLPIYKAKNFNVMRKHLAKLENKMRKR